jgi:hypothetical protein
MITESNHRLSISGAALLLALALPITGLAAPPWDAEHRPVLDERYHHDHYYPRLGVVVRDLPSGYRPFWFHGERWYFHDGVWYVPVVGGFRVASPPVGLRIAVLPPFYTTVWLGGMPYYYANGTYYRWVATDGSYEVVAPPVDANAPGAPPARAAEDLIVYPRNGQSPDQVAADRYECHNWARGETGFDPTAVPAPTATPPAGSASAGAADHAADRYRRAMTACLEGRGYSVG